MDGRPVMVRGYGIATVRDGLWASAAVVPRAALIEIPGGVELAEAAAMGDAGITAWRTVTELAQVTDADTVLVLGASGGVGSIVVPAASDIGATVVGQTGNEGDRDWVSGRGADHVVVTDASGLADAVASFRPTVVLDSLGGDFTGAAIEALQPRGRLVLTGTSAVPAAGCRFSPSIARASPSAATRACWSRMRSSVRRSGMRCRRWRLAC